MFPSIFSNEIIVDKYLCQVTFIRFKKSHRKSRINKKWHKRYGIITACVNDKAFKVGNKILVCPCMFEKMKKGLK